MSKEASPSVCERGQTNAQAEGRDVEQGISIEAFRIDNDGDRWLTSTAHGENARRLSDLAGRHGVARSQGSANDAHTEKPTIRRATAADGVADCHSSARARVRSWRAERWTSPRASSAALFGVFPNLPPAECALIEAWRPLRLETAPTPRRAPRSAGDLTGRHVGALEVLGPKHTPNGTLHWECRCACSRVVLYRAYLLNDEAREDCGRNCPLRKAVRP